VNTFLKFSSIPLVLFVFLFALPRFVASLLNSHTDIGLLTIVMLACGIFGVVASKIYNRVNAHNKETNNDEA